MVFWINHAHRAHEKGGSLGGKNALGRNLED